jgi:hypothetical protein
MCSFVLGKHFELSFTNTEKSKSCAPKLASLMSSEFDDIMRELRGSQNDIDAAIGYLSKESPYQSEERKSANRAFVVHDKVIKEIYFYLERLFRIANAHQLQMTALYESIMSLPEVQANEQLQKDIRARFQAARDTQF